MINRVVNLTMTNWRFLKDQQCGNLLQRMRHGESTREDLKLINSRVVGENLALPSFEELDGNDVSYACHTNADRNGIYSLSKYLNFDNEKYYFNLRMMLNLFLDLRNINFNDEQNAKF